ncbi:cilia- and flagella-associated protein 61 isoform X2 [Osmia lignaria lignaria]|uniref:cilia- and flagella-associated protein 61 isoform X2 n=1 Tax=Osmia lignaria lignaria TaxID=1437193 RepID=UPI00402B6B6C
MVSIWFGGSSLYFPAPKSKVPLSSVCGVRWMEHADLPILEQLMCSETYNLFNEPNLGQIYEASCLSVVQYNANRDIVSGICLCNYPNVLSVIPKDWPCWLNTLYRLENVTERNAMFVHFLAWDKRYIGHFFEALLTGVFDIAFYLQHVILVVPPRVILADVFERQMIRISPKCLKDTYTVQSLYVTVRHLKDAQLRIRRVVEEDNDEVIPIIDADSKLLKECYGEYYVSEMVRHPNNRRRLIVSENHEGLATGVMFLNSTINVDLLDDHFELNPYNGLRKFHEDDLILAGNVEPASEIFSSLFSRKASEDAEELARKPSSDRESCESTTSLSSSDRQVLKPMLTRKSMDFSEITFSELPSLTDYFNTHYYSKMLTTAFIDGMFDVPRKTTTSSLEDDESLMSKDVKLPVRAIYHGEVNAFVLEIFATQEHISDRWSQNFLQAAFECFPDLDYCTILLPFSHPYLPFLEHFVRVPLRCYKDYPMTLFLTHRAALLGQIKCRRAVPSDRDKLQILLQRIFKPDKILIDFDAATSKERSDLRCYVFLWNDIVIGTTILCAEKDTTYIRRRFHVEDYIAIQNIPYDSYGRILHFVLMPIFAIHLPSFFREIMRLTDAIVLYYRLTDSMLSALTRSQPLAICLNAMVPVCPRRRIDYKFHGYVERDEPKTEMERFSLFMTTQRLTGVVNAIIDARIVVVGASDCGIAFLEQLAFGASQNYTRFASLTLISTNGLPFENERSSVIERMIPFSGRFCREYRREVPTRTFVNVVYGTVLSIDRKQKYVTVMSQGNVSYDYLVLTSGLQYYRPQFQQEVQAQQRGELVEYETPWNCLTINDDTEASNCLEKIQLITNNFEDEKSIVFYGHSLDCYCALQGLLEAGVKASWITIIRPPLQHCETGETIFFNDCEVYTETMNSISRSGVTMLVGWKLIDWCLKNSGEEQMIETIIVQLKGRTKMINCDAFVNFSEKTMNMKIFLAICRAGLVFDGQLVIDPEFKTNDPSIFAAGTMTKYRRKYYAESWQHKYYNSIEVGDRLASVLRSLIDNHQRNNVEPTDTLKNKKYLILPMFRAPHIVACILPGGYRYLHIRKPGKMLLRSIAIRFDFYGKVLTTGSCTSEIGYFRIRLNRYDSVETITCFSKKDFEVYHMIALYGKHETMLNELKTRYQNSLISDLYAYFREPWAMAIFYDRFECLRVENRATLLSKTAIPAQSLNDDCIRALMRSKWNAVSDDETRNSFTYLEFIEHHRICRYQTAIVVPSKRNTRVLSISKSLKKVWWTFYNSLKRIFPCIAPRESYVNYMQILRTVLCTMIFKQVIPVSITRI